MNVIGRRTPWILNRMLRQAIGPAPEPTAVENFRLARNAVANVLAVPSFDITITASRESGPTPSGVVFNAFKSSVFPGVSNPKKQLSFWWDFDDAGSIFEHVSSSLGRNNANIASGWQSGHVYYSEGVRNVKCYVYDHRTGGFGFDTYDFTGVNADEFYSGANTICVDESGVFSGAPEGSLQVTSYSTAYDAFGQNKRLLFPRGQVTDISRFQIRFKTNSQIGAYGEGAKPELNVLPEIDTGPIVFYGHSGLDDATGATLWGLKIKGDYDAATGVGEGSGLTLISLLGVSNFTLSNCELDGFGQGIYPRSIIYNDEDLLAQNTLISDVKFTNWSDYGVFSGQWWDSVIVGCNIKQNPDADLDFTAKNYFSNILDRNGTETHYALPGLKIYGNPDNAIIFLYKPSTKALTRLFGGIDYTFNEGLDSNTSHSITLNASIPDDGSQLYYYVRRNPRHGPVRLAAVYDITIYQSEMFNGGGWAGTAQPCIRWNTSGGPEGTGGGYISFNQFNGGTDIVVVAPQNDVTTQFAGPPLIVEGNYLIGTDQTKRGISSLRTNVFIRNNLHFQPDTDRTGNSFDGMIKIAKADTSDSAVDDFPIEASHNTLICLISTANGATDSFVFYEEGSTSFDISSDNELLYHPDRPTPITNYDPLDSDNYYAPMGGSAAIGAGAPSEWVWDDFTGKLRAEQLVLGASLMEESATFFDLFSEYDEGAFTPQSSNYSEFVGLNSQINSSGRLLATIRTASGEGQELIIYDTGDANGSIEIYAQGIDINNGRAGVGFSTAINPTKENFSGYFIGKFHNSTTNLGIRLFRYVNGVRTSDTITAINDSRGGNYDIRARIGRDVENKITIKASIWLDSGDEPEGWMIDYVDDTAGMIDAVFYPSLFGDGLNGQPATWVKWGFSLDGNTAPSA